MIHFSSILAFHIENGNSTGTILLKNIEIKIVLVEILVGILARQVQHLSEQTKSSNEELQFLRERQQLQESYIDLGGGCWRWFEIHWHLKTVIVIKSYRSEPVTWTWDNLDVTKTERSDIPIFYELSNVYQPCIYTSHLSIELSSHSQINQLYENSII